MDGQNNDAQPSAEESTTSAPDAALETNLSPAPQAEPVQEPLGDAAGEGEEAQGGEGGEDAEAEGGGPQSGEAQSSSQEEDGGAETPVAAPPLVADGGMATGSNMVPLDVPAPEPPATPVPFDSATQSIGDTAVAPVAPPVAAPTPTPAADPVPAAPADTPATPAPADAATEASDNASDLVGHVQAALDRDGLGASVTVTQLDATESAALRVLLQSPNRDAVLQAAGALIASSAGGHTWVFIGGAPPDPVNDPEQKSGALLHAVS